MPVALYNNSEPLDSAASSNSTGYNVTQLLLGSEVVETRLGDYLREQLEVHVSLC